MISIRVKPEEGQAPDLEPWTLDLGAIGRTVLLVVCNMHLMYVLIIRQLLAPQHSPPSTTTMQFLHSTFALFPGPRYPERFSCFM